ncbi:hypothetical protein EDB19DRAFT_1829085 [Suillus lakei]|nr:hypothetical protein EDB19DRAFT_1829085 [Suillus lakei]
MSWAAFWAAFRTLWPQPTQVTLTVAQKKERIKAVVLKEDKIGVMIEEDRGREWGHVKWAKQIMGVVRGFNNTQCHLLDVVLDNTPEILRDLLADNYTSWPDFEADVAKVSASQLQRVKQRLAMEWKLCEDMDKLQSQTIDNPPTLTPQVPQTPQAAHLFAPAAPMTHGNLFYGYRGECFNCGMATMPPHQAYDCTNEPVPTQETKWRETVSRLVSRTLAAPMTPGPTLNVQFVANTPQAQYTMPQGSYATPAPPHPSYSYFADPYKAYHMVGNEYGPQQ